MANIVLGVTGSVAAIRTPALDAAFRQQGHAVRIVATHAATYFFDPIAIAPHPEHPHQRDPSRLTLDADEWPGHDSGRRWERDDPVLHIELRNWADVLVIAPLDANTLAKMACGICDNCLTCVWRAWDTQRPVVLAPAMNTLMWQHPMTRRQLRMLAVDAGAAHIPGHLDELGVIACINDRSPTLRIAPPQSKRLACGDIGIGAIAEVQTIVEMTLALIQPSNPPPAT
ncbi:flavoprotein [Tuwongella immobilis]|uniref:Flavoprotein domain-containing protein n=1 Tax=Tuwongella immobilis TaxID=692036 RepID=A0A6C2YUV3_9BACT|nr:flavoprotein [Tuwongella immobilis]VIP05518.1 phosphopantothenoylcysteine decarboxylase : Phosphopantothenoylcysteine synthetase/decarboxylase OS=Singulisphaera acidiphila (strain ATCC BAA-1392 / DSM 18658 / VKM B-2454 / MOB10) GN=Sinac_4866 PE=4 SV=1: Flavoprotein [Tuwongella immobilis]VTS08392.1 phosphopantothenoylcysteine decarboxylase : Phosphopantothenoylcysteine synthetase/decarboxylase OS=Singulisphaera acidiphila (strain ATCC BAA-1392 / DSM 18658 / VKM B-2454 / MOB10) GN=Sinac_4866 PE=